MRTFWIVAALGALVDGVTKSLAALVSPHAVYNLGQTRFGMDYNTQAAITIAVAVALVIVVKQARATAPGLSPWAGLIMAGVIGNVVSMVSGPAGVLDFIPAGNIVFNVADIWLWIGTLGVWYVVARAALRARAK